MKILKTNLRAIKWVAKMSRLYFIVMVVSSFFGNLFSYINIYFSSRIVDEIAGNRDIGTLVHMVITVLSINLCVGLVAVFCSRMEKYTVTKYDNGVLKAHLTNTYFGSDFRQLEHGTVAMEHWGIWHASRLNGLGLLAMRQSCKTLVDNTVNTVFSIIGMSSIFAIISNSHDTVNGVYLVFIIFILILLFILLSYKNSETLAKLGTEAAEIGKKQNLLSDYFNEISAYQAGKDHRIYDMELLVDGYRQDKLNISIQKNRKYYFGNRNTQIPSVVLSAMLNFSIYAFVCINAISGFFGIGSIILYAGFIQRFVSAVKNMASNFAMFKMNESFLEKNLDFYQRRATMYTGHQPVERGECGEYTIEFKDVSFKYPKTEQYVLKNLNMKIDSNKRKLAIVGMNGSGKTTMIKLLCRLYDPTEGVITLNGVDIKEYSYEEYIRLFSVVFQDFSLFAFTVGQNVAVSNEYDENKVRDRLKKSGLGESLDKWPKGLDTYLYKDFAEDGIEISGGEAQKIAISRALYKDSPFMILDEPTAALDPITEFDIYSRFNEIVGEKMVVYISHRLSSCRFCDNIAVFHEGELIQQGSHDCLVAAKDGKYHELWNAQAQYYQLQ